MDPNSDSKNSDSKNSDSKNSDSENSKHKVTYRQVCQKGEYQLYQIVPLEPPKIKIVGHTRRRHRKSLITFDPKFTNR